MLKKNLTLLLYFLYSFGWYLILPVVFCRLFILSIKAKAYRYRLKERLGIFKKPKIAQSIWIHAVSVGEAVAAVPLIKRLIQEYPKYSIVVTTMTPTGSKRVTKLLQDRVFHVYVPYDAPFAIKNFIGRVNPKLAIIMETEIWPNIIRICANKKIPVLVTNARLSKRSARRYAKGLVFFKTVFANIYVSAQTKKDAKRFKELGVPESNVSVTGSMKYDLEVPKEAYTNAKNIKKSLGIIEYKTILVAASTHPKEEEMILHAYKKVLKQHPELLLILVPRHPERSDEIIKLCHKYDFKVTLRTELINVKKDTKVILGNTIGEMLSFYCLADLVFMGGSLIPHGGQNPLEPAFFAKPILFGKFTFNFHDVFKSLIKAKAAFLVDEKDLANKISFLLEDQRLRKKMGDLAHKDLLSKQGALKKQLSVIKKILAKE